MTYDVQLAWALVIAIWCSLWWGYAAYQLLVPKDGSQVFYHDETDTQKLVQLVIWAMLVLTAPVWCLPFMLITRRDP